MFSGKTALLKTTLLDYPGEVASTLFIPGCNLRCPYCHNAGLIEPPYSADLISWEEAFQHLEKRRHLLGGVCLTGGEPLLHPQLPEIIDAIHALGLKVKLDTNGTLPQRLKEIRPDYIAMDLKGSEAGYSLMGYRGPGMVFDLIKASLQWIKESGIDHELRTTFVPGLVNQEDLAEMAKVLRGVRRYIINQFRPHNTLNPDYQQIEPYGPRQMEAFKQYLIDTTEIKEITLRGV